MAFRLYLVPVVGTGSSSADARRPKYFDAFTSGWAANGYGLEPHMLVAADLSGADDTSLTANADVTALPFYLGDTLTAGQVTATQTALESRNLPAGWVTTAFTWRAVLRVVLGVFHFMQRYHNVSGGQRLFLAGVDLERTLGSLPQQVRDDLQATANSFGYDTSPLTGGNTIRQALKLLADNWSNTRFRIGGIEI